ncbi:MAG: carbon-nitrogen hydrolase [bacterium]|nr:carbon-nitrogen hydrolase [Candidatus Sumerlaeota bacterium]
MTATFRIALVQMACSEDRGANLKKACARVAEASDAGALIVCLPELFQSQYFCQNENTWYFDLAEPVDGPATQALVQVARDKNVVIIVPFFERRMAGVFHNSAAVIDGGGEIVGIYRKMHIPDDPLYYEKYYFAPGDLGFRVFQTRYARIAVLICWDQWYPEAARIAALQGAEILFYPTAIGWHPAEKSRYGERQHSAWETVQRGHAVANGLYVAAANRVGHEKTGAGDGIEFWGSSFIADPQGIILNRASHDEETILHAECDRRLIDDVRHNWPFLRDRRIDAYAPILNRAIDPE